MAPRLQMQTWHDKLSLWFFGNENFENLDWHLAIIIDGVIFTIVLLVAFLAFTIFRKVLFKIINKIFQKTINTWDDEILNCKILNWISLLTPTLIILKASPLAVQTLYHGEAVFSNIIQITATVFIILFAFLTANSFLNIVERLYQRFDVSRELPIKGILQVIKILLLIAALIFTIAALIGKSPVLLFSGLGAMTAIMMLIFKDSILGLVAGIQLSANRMVARGDWIEMPKFGADGEVMEVALTTVKVKNWDKTITTIPTYALISDSFKNWRGMSASGVRRIKRAVNIDMSSVEFLSDELMQKMKNINLLESYLESKEKELKDWNKQHASKDRCNLINARALTNLGTFRAYINAYLRNHPKISTTETLLVRQLQPTEHGIPIELYVFSNDNDWANFEELQSDIFDHLLSILPQFELRVFQAPSDHSFAQLQN